MCYNCGCHNIYDDMGNSDNITEETFKHLAEHEGKDVLSIKKEVLEILKSGDEIKDEHLIEMFDKAAKAWGQSVAEAKLNTQRMLSSQMK